MGGLLSLIGQIIRVIAPIFVPIIRPIVQAVTRQLQPILQQSKQTGGGTQSQAPPSPEPTSPQPTAEELQEQARQREEQQHQQQLQQREIGRDIAFTPDLSGYDIEFFGDSLPVNRTALFDYSFAQNDWDESGVKTIWSWRGEVLRRTGVVSIADGFSPLSMQWLMNNLDPNVDWEKYTPTRIAQNLINSWKNDAARYEGDLGDMRGLTARQVLDRYMDVLEKRYEERDEEVEYTQQQKDYVWPNLQYDYFQHEIERWQGLQNTFDAHPDLTTDVDDWLSHELGRDTNNPAQSEASVRAYLISQLKDFGIRLDREDRTEMGLEELTQLLYMRQRRQYIALTDQYEEMTTFTELSRLSPEALNPGIEGSDADLERQMERMRWWESLTPEQQTAIRVLQGDIDASIAGMERTANLLRAYQMQYVPNTPDYGLLMLAGTILFEPLDWVVTGLQIVQDVSEGDLGGAILNAGLLALPFIAGWMDDAPSMYLAAEGGSAIPSSAADDIFEGIESRGLPASFADDRATRWTLDPDPVALPAGTFKNPLGLPDDEFIDLMSRRGVTPDEFIGSVPNGLTDEARREMIDLVYEDYVAFQLQQRYGFAVTRQPNENLLQTLQYAQSKNPDLVIEGRVFDVYSPTGSASSAASHTYRKANDLQASRMLVDLSRNNASVEDFTRSLNAWWSEEQQLEEVIITVNGQIVGHWLPPQIAS